MGLKLGHQLDLLVKVAAFSRQFAASLFQLPNKECFLLKMTGSPEDILLKIEVIVQVHSTKSWS